MKNDREFVGTLRGFDYYVSLCFCFSPSSSPFTDIFTLKTTTDIVLDDVTE